MTFAVCHDLTDGRANDVHLCGGKPVPARKVTRRASWANIAFYMGQGIINAVQTAWVLCSPAIDAWLRYVCEHFCGRKVTRINFLIRGSQKDSPPLVSFCVALLSRNNLRSLFRCVVLPAIRAIVAPSFSLTVASPALIGQPERARSIAQKDFRRGGQKLFAPVAITETIFGRDKSFSHKDMHSMITPICKDGPHWQLPWKQYP